MYEIAYRCGCGNTGEIKIQARAGQPFISVPDLWCVKCPVPLPMSRQPPKRLETSLIATPSLVAPIDVTRRT
jgi:hypothetical protein